MMRVGGGWWCWPKTEGRVGGDFLGEFILHIIVALLAFCKVKPTLMAS